MTLANRLKAFIILWFAIAMAVFSGAYITWFHAHSIASKKAWIGQELSDITSQNGIAPSAMMNGSVTESDGMPPGTGIRFLLANGQLVTDEVNPNFPGDILQQMEKFLSTHQAAPGTDNSFGPLIQWYPVFNLDDDTGHHSILTAQAPIYYENGTQGIVQVFTTLDSVTASTDETLRILIWTSILTLILLTVGLHPLVNRGLQPLKLLIDGIRSVEWAQTKRLNLNHAPREIKSVVNSVNQLLEQVDKGVRDQSRFIADASHELRTPLAIIAGHVNILRRWGNKNEQVWEPAVHHIVSEVGRLQSLIDRLLLLSRLESGFQAEPQRLTSSELRNLLLQLRDDARLLRPDLNIKSLIQLAGHVETNISKDDLRQAMVILVDNAMKHTQAGGHVDMMANWDDNSIRISVVDTGSGIPAPALPHVFDRFYRAEESRARTLGGSGLGLSICKEIAEAYGGKITIRSKEWSGTTVTILLPRIEMALDNL